MVLPTWVRVWLGDCTVADVTDACFGSDAKLDELRNLRLDFFPELYFYGCRLTELQLGCLATCQPLDRLGFFECTMDDDATQHLENEQPARTLSSSDVVYDTASR